MNIKSIVILTACVFFIAGCNKSPTPPPANNSASPQPPPVQAEPFHNQVYKSLDGRKMLTLISKDECEYTEGRDTVLGKYTKQTDSLRVVLTVMGTSQVVYFRFTDQGLQDNNGNVLLSPENYAAAIEQIRQAKIEEMKKQKEAAQKQLDEENRQKAAMEERENNFFSWLRTYCEKGAKFDSSFYNIREINQQNPITLTITTDPLIQNRDGQTVLTLFGTVHWNGVNPIAPIAIQDNKFKLSGNIYLSADNDAQIYVNLDMSWWDPTSNQYQQFQGPTTKLTETKQASEYLKTRRN
jgi:hypothetical protein